MAEEVIELLARQWQALITLVGELADDEWRLPTQCPGWSVADNIAHVVGTESSLAGMPSPVVPEHLTKAPHVHNPIGEANEAWVASMRSASRSEVQARLAVITSLRLVELRAMTEAQLESLGPSPVGQVPYREFMDVRLMDCWVHEQDIRRATRRPGHLDGPIVERSLDRFQSAMPVVVARKAGLADGVARIVLTGPAHRTITVVAVAGRGRVQPDSAADASPTVTVTLDAEAWWCGCLGRWDPGLVRAAGGVTIDGDAGLGQRIIDSLAFMI